MTTISAFRALIGGTILTLSSGAEFLSLGPLHMKLTNHSYTILIGTKNFKERYYRDKAGWLKVSARGRTFRITAEQVLNHVLPALAGIKPNLTIKVEHRDANVRPDL